MGRDEALEGFSSFANMRVEVTPPSRLDALARLCVPRTVSGLHSRFPGPWTRLVFYSLVSLIFAASQALFNSHILTRIP
jgi:hypothetical protein